LHHFFEAQVRSWLSEIENVLCSALVLQKNVTAFASRKLLPQMPIGVERPRNVGEKSISGGSCGGNTFLSRWHVRLRGLAERSVGGTLHQLHKSFIEARARWRVSDRAAILHNVLMQPAAKKL
jgi:hypothetical protein